MKNKSLTIFLSIIMFCVGVVAGIGGFTYFTLPHNEELVHNNSVFYSLTGNDVTVAVAEGVQQAEPGAVAVHFLELGNKYTGDCTYIKVGENIDILIDCGSKSNSVPTVSNYLNRYVTDGVLEYVIVTHAHQDHYAGFATSAKVDSIFDLFECETIITFATTNQKTPVSYLDTTKSTDEEKVSNLGIKSYAETTTSTSTLYANFNRELTAELDTALKVENQADLFDYQAGIAGQSFVVKFWNGTYLYDYVDGDYCNKEVRPNMLFAVSLPYSALDRKQQKSVVDIVTRELLTIKGLRSLSPKSGMYRPEYIGGELERDRNYHNGPIWPWTTASFVEAYLKVYKMSGVSFVMRIMAGFEPEMKELTLCTLSELYDGNPPFRGHGAMSFAMSVAEVIRAYTLMQNALSTMHK